MENLETLSKRVNLRKARCCANCMERDRRFVSRCLKFPTLDVTENTVCNLHRF